MQRNIKIIRENDFDFKKVVQWFHKKWNVAIEAYEESMMECILKRNAIPQWYVLIDEKENIIAGAGVIENDFHIRKDLKPNICALFVEEQYRKKGIRNYILNFILEDLKKFGCKEVYLVTDHTTFYEKCG